jgi:hypothetical protein
MSSRRPFVAIGFTALLAACSAGTPAPVPDAQPVRMAPADSAPATTADVMPTALRDAFTADDARARAISFWLQCTPTVARLRAEGAFGPAARAPRAIVCQRTADGVPVGGVYDVDSAFTGARRLQMIRLDGARPKYLEPVDTAGIVRAAKLARDVSVLVSPAWKKRARPFSVVPVHSANGTAEAWVIPRATKARSFVTGGDMGYTAAASGTGAPTLIVDRSATWTQLNLAPTGPLRIYSSVRDIAAVTDLATARYYAELGRSVTLSTPAFESTLVPGLDPATGARLVWKHTPVRK